jgi:hypothetical protein
MPEEPTRDVRRRFLEELDPSTEIDELATKWREWRENRA